MVIREYIRAVWRWWWVVALGSLLAGATAFTVSQRMVPVYEASTTLLVGPASATGTLLDASIMRTSTGLARTYVWMLTSRPVLRDVVTNLKLDTDPGQLAARISVKPLRDTQLIVLTVEDSDPQRAADIASETVRVFNAMNKRLQTSSFELVAVEPAQAEATPVRPKVWLNAGLAASTASILLVGWVLAGHYLAVILKPKVHLETLVTDEERHDIMEIRREERTSELLIVSGRGSGQKGASHRALKDSERR